MIRSPGGVIPVSVLPAMLGVSKTRVKLLIRTGRLPVTLPMPGTTMRFVPADALLSAPTMLEQGRPLRRKVGNGFATRDGPEHNPWCEADTFPQSEAGEKYFDPHNGQKAPNGHDRK